MKTFIKIAKPKMKDREWKLVVVTMVLVSAFGFLKFVVKKTATLNQIQSENSSLQTSIQGSQNLLNQMRIEAATKARASTDQNQSSLLEKNNNFASLLSRLSGDGAQFLLNRLVVEEHKEVSGYSRTLFSLEIETTFIELGKFIEGLENSEFLVDFQSLEISRIEQELKRSKAQIKLYSYASRGVL